MRTVNVNDTRSRIRREADIETADEAKSICNDAELLEYMNDGWRRLHNLLTELSAVELLGKSASLTSPYALPSDFLQLIGVDYNGQTLHPFSLLQRNITYGADFPRYRIQAGSLLFNPSTFTGSVTLWYIPEASTLSAGGTYSTFADWDTFIVAHAKLRVRQKQEYDTMEAERDLQAAERQVRRNAARVKPEPGVIHDVRSLPDEFYFG